MVIYKTLDTETTGLRIWKDDRLFCLAIGDDKEQAFIMGEDLLSYKKDFDNPEITWIFHNAKFDLAVLHKEGVEIKGPVLCTEVLARLVENDLMSYKLEVLAKHFKLKNQKLTDVKDYCLAHGLWEWETIPGKKTRSKNFFFTKVPLEILEEYNKSDVACTHELALFLLKTMKSLDENRRGNIPSLQSLLDIEMKITKILFKMETRGILVDVRQINRGVKLEKKRNEDALDKFEEHAGIELIDSAKGLRTLFDTHGLKYGSTKKGNPSFKNIYLEPQKGNPIIASLLEFRESYKTLGTYYQSYLYHKDDNDVIHTNIRQAGTVTGRFSCSSPNLQNLKKVEESDEDEDDDEIISAEAQGMVRSCFVPRPGYTFLCIDYDQVEYRLMLDYAGELGLIGEILGGLDVHQATANAIEGTRSEGKTINFGLLYGQGVDALAAALKVPRAEAVRKKNKYFEKLPNVEKFIEGVIGAARRTGVIYNKFGRRCNFKDKNFSYKAPNALIQGGCADVMRMALIGCDEVLQGTKSHLLLQVHDEAIIEIHNSERHLAPLLKAAFEKAYIGKYLPLTAGMDEAYPSWQNKKLWV